MSSDGRFLLLLFFEAKKSKWRIFSWLERKSKAKFLSKNKVAKSRFFDFAMLRSE